MRKLLLLTAMALALLGSPRPARAAGTAGAEPFNFLLLDANARAVGLGGAYTTLAADSNALLYNPAGLGRIRRHEVTVMHNQYVEGLTQEYMGLAVRQGFGLQLNYLRFGGLDRTTYSKPGGTLGKFDIQDMAFGAGYGHTFFESLSLGLGGKFIKEQNDNVTAQGYAFDAGMLLSHPELPGLTFGLAGINIGPDVRFLRDKEKLPLQLRGGLSYAWKEMTVAADATKERHDQVRVAAGIERTFAGRAAVRVGFTSRNDAADVGIVGGAGLIWKDSSIDYAFMPFGELGLTHRVSLTLRWGRVLLKPAEEDAKPIPGLAPRSGLPSQTPEDHFAAARVLIDDKQFPQAQAELEAALRLLGPDDRRRVLYYERQGFIAFSKRDIGKANAYYTEALRLASALGLSDLNVADAYEGMGRVLLSENQPEYALKFFKKAFDVSPSLKTRELVEETERRLAR